MPRVSVVLIFLNEQRFLEEAVQSVRDQTLADWELILVDDGSTDRSTQIARDLAAADERIRYVDHFGHANRGMSASRNLGVTHATAPYIGFLDGDDVWNPDKLAEQVELLETMQDVALVCGAQLYWYSWDPASTKADRTVIIGWVGDRRLNPPEAALALQPLGPAPSAGVDLLVRRSVFEAVGGFENRFHGVFEDQAFLIKVYLRYPVYISSRVWLRYRHHISSCLRQTTRTNYCRQLAAFLDWLEEDPGRLTDIRVSAAVRRARHKHPYRMLVAPAYEAADRLFERIPLKYKDPVNRILAARRSRLRRRYAAQLQPRDGLLRAGPVGRNGP